MLSKAIVLMASIGVTLAACGCVSGAEKEVPPKNRNTYIYCNVYQGGACFGVTAGDEVRMTIPADYVRYEVKSGDGRDAIVYYGYNQSIVDSAMRDEFDECTATKEICRFVVEAGARIEAVYSGSRETSTVHLLLTGINQTNRKQAREFVENFRPCQRVAYDLMCRDERIFVTPSDQRGRR